MIRCNICDNARLVNIFERYRFGKLYVISECPNCGLVFVKNMPTKNELAVHYETRYGYQYMEMKRVIRKDVSDVKLIKRYLGENSLLCDVGCGSGLFVKAAALAGMHAKGIDLSKEVVRFGRIKLGLTLMQGDFLNIKINKMDVITMRHFLEHTRSPKRYLEKAGAVLKKKGLLFICVPNIDSYAFDLCEEEWQWMSPPAHLFFFTPRSLEKILDVTGFEIVNKFTRTGDANNFVVTLGLTVVRLLGIKDVLRRILPGSTDTVTAAHRKKSFEDMSWFKELSYVCNLPFLPIEKIMNERLRGPELCILAKRK